MTASEAPAPVRAGSKGPAASRRTAFLVRAGSISYGSEEGQEVVLNLEYIADKTTKALLRLGWFGTLAAITSLILEARIKLGQPSWWTLQHNEMEIANTCLASFLLALLLGVGGVFFWSVAAANRSGKQWTHRRARLVLLTSIEIGVQLVNLVFFLTPNAYLLSWACSWFVPFVHAGAFVRYSCWNTLAMLWAIQAHSLLPVDGSAGWINWALGMQSCSRTAAAVSAAAAAGEEGEGASGLMVADLPLSFHLPKVLLLWLPAEAALFMLMLYSLGTIGPLTAWRLPDELCEQVQSEEAWQAGLNDDLCAVRGTELALACIAAALIVTQLLLYWVLAVVARRKLQQLPYGPYRVSNIELRIQFRTKLVALSSMLLSLVVLWFIDVGSCNSFIFTSLGITPMQLSISVMVAINGVLYRPFDPSPEQRQLHEVLQDFAWTEAEVPAKLWRRRVADKSLFCFECAVKALYWSWYIYSDERSLETGLRLFGLQRHTLFQERQRDSKCMVAWGGRTIVVAFRGTASLANIAADVKVWRKVHPPQRGSYLLGSQPMVHTGFLQSWQAGELNQQVLGLLRDIITGAVADSTAEGAQGPGAADSGAAAEGVGATAAAAAGSGDGSSAGDGSQANGSGMASLGGAESPAPQQPHSGGNGWQPPWRIICTGHSLGGALAMLASYDIAGLVAGGLGRGCTADVSVFTFGAPRPGNAAFAADFLRQVPDSWDIFHSNDAVAVEGKFGCLYKRAAHRVILTATRDIIVRPSHVEASMQRGATSSVSAHLLRNYARSLRAILRTQFKKGTLGREQVAALRLVDVEVLKVIANTFHGRRGGGGASPEMDALTAAYSFRANSWRSLGTASACTSEAIGSAISEGRGGSVSLQADAELEAEEVEVEAEEAGTSEGDVEAQWPMGGKAGE